MIRDQAHAPQVIPVQPVYHAHARSASPQRDARAPVVVILGHAHNARAGKGTRGVRDVVRDGEAESVVVGWLVSLLVRGGEGVGEDALPGAAVHAHVQVVPRHPRLRVHSPPRDGEGAADDSRRRAHPHLRRRRVTRDVKAHMVVFVVRSAVGTIGRAQRKGTLRLYRLALLISIPAIVPKSPPERLPATIPRRPTRKPHRNVTPARKRKYHPILDI